MFSFRLRTAAALALPVFLLTGCGYVHFGRLPTAATDRQLAAENADLKVEKKVLQQELILARKEGDTLRSLLESRSGPADAAGQDLATKLNDTTRELATLRASYARLQEERNSPQRASRPATGTTAATGTLAALEQVADLRTRLSDTEEKLAGAMRTYTQLQEETTRLRSELTGVRTENSRLTVQVRTLSSQFKEAQAALADLNSELLAQKRSRAQAEQDADAVRAQMQVIAARGGSAHARAAARAAAATGGREQAAPVKAPNLPDADTPSTARLATNPERLRAAAGNTAPSSPTATPAKTAAAAPSTSAPAAAAPAPQRPLQLHVVKVGETLESIAKIYYGRSDRWTLIYAANNALLSGGRPLRAGMRLDIPAE